MTEQSHYADQPEIESRNHITDSPKEPLPLASLAVHNTLHEAEKLTEHTPDTFLHALREHFQATPASSWATGPKAPFIPPRDQLLRIHDSLDSYETSKVVTRTDVNRLGISIWRLQATIPNAPRFTFSFLRDLYLEYREDAKAFKRWGMREPGALALYHSPAIIQEIEQRYAQHPAIHRNTIISAFVNNRLHPAEVLDSIIARVRTFQEDTEPRLREEYGYKGEWSPWFVRDLVTVQDGEAKARKIFSIMQQLETRYPHIPLHQFESLAKRAVNYRGQRGKVAQESVGELLADVPQFDYTADNLTAAAEQLGRLRQAHHEGIYLRPGGSTRYEGIWLAHVAKANWHDAFESIDIEKESRRLQLAVNLFNQSAASQEKYPPLDLDPQNLCHMLVVFANDVAAFRQKGVWNPAKAAIAHDPSMFDYYKEKFAISDGALKELFAHSASRHGGVEKSLIQFVELKKRYGSFINTDLMCEWACKPNALTQIPKIIGSMNKTMELYPWANKSDILRAGKHAEESDDLLGQWDARIKELARLYPKHKDLPMHRRKKLTKDIEGDVAANVSEYFARVTELEKIYDRSPYVHHFYALRWAENKERYLQLAEDHNIRVQKIIGILQKEGHIDIGDDIVSNLAFYYKTLTPEQRVSKFLANRQALDSLRQVHRLGDYIEQWMVDLVSARNTSLKYLRVQLKTLAEMNKAGNFRASSFKDFDLTYPKNPANDALKLTDDILSYLAPLDQQAIMLVFGFAQDISKTQLEEELDVPDLDKYVMEDVVPHLAMRLKK